MKLAGKRPAAVAVATTCALVLGSGAGAWAADVGSAQVQAVLTSAWTPPSPDPSGITYLGGDKFLIADAEVNEITAPQPGAYQDANLFSMTSAGNLVATGTTLGWSAEPTGVALAGTTLYVADDDKKSVFTITSAGADGVWGTADDAPPSPATGFKTSTFNNTDPEGIAYDSNNDELLLVNGQTGARFYRLTKGANGKFDGIAPGGDDTAFEFDLTRYGVQDPEGISYDASRDTIVVSDDGSEKLYELDHNGALLNTIDLSGIALQNVGDVVVAPSSSGTGNSYWLVDRGLDNNSYPDENDGRVVEVKADLGAITNFPPAASAGVDQLIDIGETVTLSGGGVDKDAGDTLSYRWTVTGPGTVTLDTPNQATTKAGAFSSAGDYVFRLTVTDSQGATGFDEATVRVFLPGTARNVSLPIVSGADDAQEGGGTSGTFVDLASADDELGNDGPPTPDAMLLGLRFQSLPVPPGSEIVSARIQFKVDEAGSDPASFRIRGEASGNAAGYVAKAGNISSRAATTASVQWTPPAWSVIGEAGPDQLTPDLAVILQEIIDRPDWQRGNAAAFMIDGSGRRTAEGKDGLSPPVLRLEFKTPVPNQAPIVNAGADATVTMPNAVTLDGTVTDDGKPNPAPTTTWTTFSGPGTVTFGNDKAVDTTATFSEAGDYVLRLTANDGTLEAFDDIQVTVSAAPTTGGGGTGGGGTGGGGTGGGGSTPPPTQPTDPPQEPTEPPTEPPAEPPAQTQQVTAGVSDDTVMTGRMVRVRGTVSPAADGQVVQLQRRKAGSWKTLGRVRIGSDGTAAAYAFKTTSKRSGAVRYRVRVLAHDGMAAASSSTMRVRYYRAAVTKVSARHKWVRITNTGAVAIDLGGWQLRNNRNGKVATLKSMVVLPGRSVRVHSGAGRDNARNMYLGRKALVGRHGKVVLRDDTRRLANRFRF